MNPGDTVYVGGEWPATFLEKRNDIDNGVVVCVSMRPIKFGVLQEDQPEKFMMFGDKFVTSVPTSL